MNLAPQPPPFMESTANRRYVAVAITGAIWVIVTALFWVGYTGEDDLMYARYAYLFHRPPSVWWEFRMPAILAMRGSFLVFGPTEFAAAFPSLIASLAILASVAWLVDWPRTLTWQTQAAMLVAAIIPIDVGFRSYPAAHQIAAGLLALGTASVLKGGHRGRIVGGILLASGFATHEASIFYVGLFCVVCLAFDRRRYAHAVLWCICVAAGSVAVEAGVYAWLLGDPLARLATAAGSSADLAAGVDPDVGLSGLAFYLWPLRIVLFAKHFGFDLLLLLLCGAFAWPRFDREQRILLVTTFAVLAWLGYGSQVPWAYKPLYRQFHYYNSLTAGIAALLPFAVGYALVRRVRLAAGVVGFALCVHLACLASSGRWGAEVDVSRALLRYAADHPNETFLTDVNTMNQMYVVGGFRLPSNVVCLDGPAVEQHLLLNKEPPGTPRFVFQAVAFSGGLVNRELREHGGVEAEFSNLLVDHASRPTTIVGEAYRFPFSLIPLGVQPRGFMIRSAGAELVSLNDENQPRLSSPDSGNATAGARRSP